MYGQSVNVSKVDLTKPKFKQMWAFSWIYDNSWEKSFYVQWFDNNHWSVFISYVHKSIHNFPLEI